MHITYETWFEIVLTWKGTCAAKSDWFYIALCHEQHSVVHDYPQHLIEFEIWFIAC